jgi:hypothetical protein
MSPQPDVEIAAIFRADELRFECEPRTSVRVHSDSPAEAEYVSERDNLPDQVEPGVTYRDVSVAWRVSARLSDPDF